MQCEKGYHSITIGSNANQAGLLSPRQVVEYFIGHLVIEVFEPEIPLSTDVRVIEAKLFDPKIIIINVSVRCEIVLVRSSVCRSDLDTNGLVYFFWV